MTDSPYDMRTLQEASYCGRLDAVRQFVTQGVDINATDDECGGTALMVAVQEGHVEIVRFLLDNGANPNDVTGDCKTLLHWAVDRANAEIARMLLEAGAEVNAGDWEDKTPLMRASSSGNLEMVTLLLDYGANANAQTANNHPDYSGGATALIQAVKGEHIEVARLLLDRGADVNAQDASGMSVLDWAMRDYPWIAAREVRPSGNATPLVKLLRERGAKAGQRRPIIGRGFCLWSPSADDK